MDKYVKMVKEGYELAADEYLHRKDETQHEIPIFKTWLNHVLILHQGKNRKIIELGCASGFPIGKKIIEKISETKSKLVYTGIDLSTRQIELAHEKFPKYIENFKEAEMVAYVKSLKENSISGIVSMFSIRHVPRNYHVDLFQQIFRALEPNGYFLMDCPLNPDDGFIDENWLGGSSMYWSTFSRKWTELTLKEIGFDFVEIGEDTKEFFGDMETTLFFLLRKNN